MSGARDQFCRIFPLWLHIVLAPAGVDPYIAAIPTPVHPGRTDRPLWKAHHQGLAICTSGPLGAGWNSTAASPRSYVGNHGLISSRSMGLARAIQNTNC